MNEFANNIMRLRYSHGDESWEDISNRVVDNVLSVVNIKQDIKDALKWLINERKFIPGGRFLAQSGRPYHQVNNCFLLRAEDTREGWGDLMNKAGVMLMSGGGIGIDYSNLREEGALLKRSGGMSSGPIPLMKVINEIGRGVMSGGKRRSAIWAGLNWNHPDIEKFILLKNWIPEVRKLKEKDFDFPAPMDMTNISVILDREFFDAYHDENNLKHSLAKLVYWTTIERMLKTGEPGFSVDYNNKNESLRNAPVCKDTYVMTEKGYVKVEDIIDMPVSLFTGDQFVHNVIFKKTKENARIIRVQMTGQREIRCDEDHEFFVVKSKWISRKKKQFILKVKAKDLKKGDSLLIKLPEYFVNDANSPRKDFYTLGYLYGDGSFSSAGKAEVTLCSDESKDCLEYLKTDLVSSVTENDSRGYTRIHYKTNDYFKNRYKEVFPDEIYTADFREKLSFLAGLWDADGNFSRGTTYRLSSIHPSFLIGVRRLLESVGILSHISKSGISTYGKKQTYQLVVTSEYADLFSQLIPMIRVERKNLSNYKSYRDGYIKVENISFDGFEDVYCVDVKVPEHSFMADGVIISNCTEIVSEDDSDVCCLGSINLANISSIDELNYVTELGTLFLIAGTEYSDSPTDKVKTVREKNRRIGLGIMGFHEWLIKKEYFYGENVELAQWLASWKMQSDISAESWANKLSFNIPIAKRAIAPNGSISIAGGMTTSGIEPIFSVAYQRRYLTPEGWRKQYVIDPVAERLVEMGVDHHSIEDALSLSLDVERRIKFQAFVQQFVDNSISSTINLPAFGQPGNDSIESFGNILIKYLPLLRGITVYPDGARGGQPLVPVEYEYAIKHKNLVFEGNEDCIGGVCGI